MTSLPEVKSGIGMVGDNVLKTMDGRKTQTRRVEACLRDLPQWLDFAEKFTAGGVSFKLFGGGFVRKVTPRYQPGNAYYVKECLEMRDAPQDGLYATYQSDSVMVRTQEGGFRGWQRDDGTPWKPNTIPAIYMPKSAARTFIEITDVKCERLHDISVDDIVAEGVSFIKRDGWSDQLHGPSYREAWKKLWSQCNGKGSHDLNPWVFCYEYELVEVRR